MDIEDDSQLSTDLIQIDQKYIKNLSFSGGGYRGLSFLGCVKALQEKEVLHSVKSIAGSSVGSIVATLVVCGSEFSYLKDVAIGITKFFSHYKFDLYTLLTRGSNMRNSYGLYNTESLRAYVRDCIQKTLDVNYDITFQDLFSINPIELIITASCLETQTPFYFSVNTTKDTPVSEAIAISCSIPFLFGKTEFDNKTLVDGALIEKLPMQCWPQDEVDYTMAFLIQQTPETAKRATSFNEYIHQIETSIFSQRDDNYINKYRNSITLINAASIPAFGEPPGSDEVNKVIYAAYFQTLSELARRNFVDEDLVPKSQEISSLIISDYSSEHVLEYPMIRLLVVILLIVSILKIISI